jgi:hypothetical protein
MVARSILIRMETSMGHSARRRADLDRMKAKAVRFGKQWHQGDRKRHDGAFVEKCQKIANHLAICSGPCCGNPRRWFGELTMQERRASEIGRP